MTITEAFNFYVTAGIIAALLHILSMLLRKQSASSILKVAAVTLIAWPLLPILYLKFLKYLEQRKKPLGERPSAEIMLQGVKMHFEGMPHIVIAYDTEKEHLHIYSNTSDKGRLALLKNAIKAHEEQES